MSVYQGTEGGSSIAGTPANVESINLDMEEMSEGERLSYLSGRLGSEAMAEAYLRSMVQGDPDVDSEAIGDIDQKSVDVGCNEFTTNTPGSTRISKYYTLDLLSSKTVYTKYNIVPHQGLSKSQIMCNLKHLAVNSLDPIREWHKAVKVGSAFRSNSSTDHGAGSAADLYFFKPNSTTRMSVPELVVVAKTIIYELKVPFTQLLLESSGNGTGWIHIANRKNGQNSGMRVGYSLNNGGTFHAGLPKL